MTARDDVDDRKTRHAAAPAFGADGFVFAAPLTVRVHPARADDTLTVACIDDALAALGVAGDLRYGADGRERPEWSEALDCAAGAKFDRTAQSVEAARRAFRAYASAAGILVTIRPA